MGRSLCARNELYEVTKLFNAISWGVNNSFYLNDRQKRAVSENDAQGHTRRCATMTKLTDS